MARSDPRPASLNQSPTISRAQLGGNDIGNGATPTPSGRNIAAAARSSPAPTGSARKPSLVIFTQDGQKTSRARANKADGQRAVNAYFAEHGYWPQAFKDGNFTVKRVREQEAAAGPSQEEGSEQTPSSPKRKIGIDTLGSNAKRQNQGGEISSGRNNFGIPAPARKRKLSPDAEDSGPKRKTTQASSSAGREDLNSYYPAPAQSLARSIAPGKRQLNADTEESAPKRKTTEAAFTAGGEGLHSDSLTPEQGSPQPQLQSRESAPQLDFDLPLIPDFETDLPPIPDIQKSFHQLEQEALYNGIRPSWFSRAEWNKPIPTEWPNFEPESDSDEVEGDAEERRDYLERTKATQVIYCRSICFSEMLTCAGRVWFGSQQPVEGETRDIFPCAGAASLLL